VKCLDVLGLSADIAMASGELFLQQSFREESTMSILFRIPETGAFPLALFDERLRRRSI